MLICLTNLRSPPVTTTLQQGFGSATFELFQLLQQLRRGSEELSKEVGALDAIPKSKKQTTGANFCKLFWLFKKTNHPTGAF